MKFTLTFLVLSFLSLATFAQTETAPMEATTPAPAAAITTEQPAVAPVVKSEKKSMKKTKMKKSKVKKAHKKAKKHHKKMKKNKHM